MCRAVSTLVYGLPVRTMSLLFAADAWPDLQPPFRFFDLISLRLRRGTLCSTSSVVQAVPVEVWDLVKDELVRVEVDQKEADFVRRIGGGQTWCRLETLGNKARWADVRRATLTCGSCYEACFDFCANSLSDDVQRLLPFLSNFGLSMPPSGVAVLRQQDEDWLDFDLATYLTLPVAAVPAYGLEVNCGGDSGPDEQAALPISFRPPPADADERFHRLLRSMYLQPLEVSLELKPPPVKRGFASPSPKPSFVRSFKDIPVSMAKPGWAMLSTCITTW